MCRLLGVGKELLVVLWLAGGMTVYTLPHTSLKAPRAMRITVLALTCRNSTKYAVLCRIVMLHLWLLCYWYDDFTLCLILR
jgi:hypothetical protein